MSENLIEDYECECPLCTASKLLVRSLELTSEPKIPRGELKGLLQQCHAQLDLLRDDEDEIFEA